MRRLISASLLFFVKLFARIFYRFDIRYLGDTAGDPWRGVRIIVFLNHTSLFEPLFLGALPNWFLWQLSDRLVAPGADKTLNRPLVGRFYRLLSPRMIPVTRRRDSTWTDFLQVVGEDAIVVILPEGRMKRRTGLDKDGKPMTIRGGVGDVLNRLEGGKMAITYSAGLHHIQAPGELPRLFKTVRANVEIIELLRYKQELGAGSPHEFKLAVVRDLQERMKRHTPPPPEA